MAPMPDDVAPRPAPNNVPRATPPLAPPSAPDLPSPLAFAYGECHRIVRDADRDRYLAGLFAPAEARRHIFALYAFSHEIARVRDMVSEPMPGEIRLQWWHDALAGAARGDAAAHPVAAALIDTIERFGLPRQAFIDLIEARVFDLYNDPMPTVADLEGYCGETSSALIRLAGLVLANGEDLGGAEAAGHAGVAYAVTGLLRAFALHAARGQIYLPKDLLARNGVASGQIVAGEDSPGLRAALAEIRALARPHLSRVDELRPTIAPPARPAFLPLALAPLYLARMERGDYAPFRTAVEVPQWRRQWRLWRAAR
jgi:15-cis-phytoene synthase